MPVERQALALIVLGGWVAAWWLAVRGIFGRRFGLFEWVPVAFLAFGVPLLVLDLAAASAWGFTDGQLLAVWGGIAVVIDATWGVRRVARWYADRGAEQDA